MSTRQLSPEFYLIFKVGLPLLKLLNLCRVFGVMPVVLLPFNIDSPYIVHTSIMVCICYSCVCLTLLTLFNLRQISMFRSVCLLPYNLGSSYLVPPLIIVRKYKQDIGHLTLALLSWSTLCRKEIVIM